MSTIHTISSPPPLWSSTAGDAVVIWETVLDECWKNALPGLYAILAPDEKNKADRFLFEKDRTCSIVARGLLRILLQHYTQIPSAQLQLIYGEHKKPLLSPQQQPTAHAVYFNFNVSHSADRILHAFSAHACMGVDIERIRRDREVLSIAEHYFTSHECAQILQCPKDQQHRNFYRLWSHKEAFIKAIGKGLFQSLQDFEVTLPVRGQNHSGLNILSAEAALASASTWTLCELSVHDEFASAVAIASSTAQMQVYRTRDFFRP